MQITRFPGQPEWLAARSRRDAVSATDVAKILMDEDGYPISPYGSPWSVYRERVLGERDEIASEVLERGLDFEPVGLKRYERATGMEVEACEGVVLIEDGWKVASPDGFVGQGGVDIKTDAYPDETWAEDRLTIPRWSDDYAKAIPPQHALQGYWLLEISGREWWDFCCLVPHRTKFVDVRCIVRLERDPETQARIVDAVGEWRERHLVQGVEPPIDGSEGCTRALAKRFPVTRREKRQATAAEVDLVSRLAQLRHEKKLAELEEREVVNQLGSTIGDAGGLLIGSGSLTWVRMPGRRTLDRVAVLAERPDLAALLDRHTTVGADYAVAKLNKL